MSLYLKHRPTKFSEVRGNSEAVAMLESFAGRTRDDRPHFILLQGPYGCGKTTLARITATAFGCTDHTMDEVNAANHNGVDDVRALEENAPSMPLFGDAKAVILDECHMMSKPAQDALLKLLEDTPKHLYIFGCTTDPNKLHKTIRSRATQITVDTLSDRDMKRLIVGVSADEGVDLPPEVLDQIVHDSLGHPRDALVILDSIKDLAPEQMLSAAKRVAEAENMTLELCRLLSKNSTWKEVSAVLDGIKDDPERIRYAVLGYFRNCLKRSGSKQHARIIQVFSENTYSSGDAGLWFMVWVAVNGG